MRSLNVGTICIKTTGREAGNKAIVREIVDDKFVIIEGVENSQVRKRKCNIAHLIPITAGEGSKRVAGKKSK